MPKLPVRLKMDDILLDIDAPQEMEGNLDINNKTWAACGQERILKALEMSISIKSQGYNIFVVGMSGFRCEQIIMEILNSQYEKKNHLRDIVYVQNFQDSDKPIPLIFPVGMAGQFKDDLDLLMQKISKKINTHLTTKAYRTQQNVLIAEFNEWRHRKLIDFENQLNKEGFRMVQADGGIKDGVEDIVFLKNGFIIPLSSTCANVASDVLDEEEWATVRNRYYIHQDTIKAIYREIQLAEENLSLQIKKLKSSSIRECVEKNCADFVLRWKEASIKKYIQDLAQDVIEHVDIFTHDGEEQDAMDIKLRYGVNILLEHHENDSFPVIYEPHPTKAGLWGVIEAYSDISSAVSTNMMMIKSGSLVRADGGVLILQAEDVLAKEELWADLKFFLQTGQVVPDIQSASLGSLPVLMKPKPIQVETTVILLGSEKTYESLCLSEHNFFNLFSIAAEFSPVMPRSSEAEDSYVCFIRELIQKENLRPINSDGIQEIIFHGIQLAERRDYLSTYFNVIGDVLRESHYIAEKENCSLIDDKLIRKAINLRENFRNLSEKVFLEQIFNGSIFIDVNGSKVGTVNGLAVLEQEPYTFGIPMRITVAVSPGKEGLINIESESGLSGELHDKGMYLLEGYLRYRFARYHNISLTASIAVEQSYSEIDGDSASAAELVALLSAIAEISVRQDVAVTGSVNQRGAIQAVGGISKKIQGFYNVCEAKGLTGNQGVVIPYANMNNVILQGDVIDALKKELFHIWVAQDINEIMTLLTGMNAGRIRRNNRFTSRSINEAIRRGLVSLSDLS